MPCVSDGGPVVSEKKILIDWIVFYAVSEIFQPLNGGEDFEIEISIKYFCYYLSMEIGMVHPLIKLNHVYPKVLCANIG